MTALLQDLLARLEMWRGTLQDLGWWGVLAYALAIIVLQMAFVPLAPFALAGGAIFGFTKGFVALTLGTNLGAIANFLIARHLARGMVTRYLAHHEKFRAIDAAIGREGGKIVALLRMCPMPFGFANYAYGLTAVRFWPYTLATCLAIIPANILFVWAGATAQEGLAVATGTGRARGWFEYVLLGVGLIAAFCALAYITRIAKAAVAKGERAPEPAPVQDSEAA